MENRNHQYLEQDDYYDYDLLPFADFGSRLGAKLLDIIIFWVGGALLLRAIVPLFANQSHQEGEPPVVFIFGVIFMYLLGPFIFNLVYTAIFESSSFQATPGKIITGIKVVDRNDQRISFGRSFKRSLSRILSGLILYIGYLMVLFNRDKQALHDQMTNTHVVRDKHDLSEYNNLKLPLIVGFIALIIVPFFYNNNPKAANEKADESAFLTQDQKYYNALNKDKKSMTFSPDRVKDSLAYDLQKMLEEGEVDEGQIKYLIKKENDRFLVLIKMPFSNLIPIEDRAETLSMIESFVQIESERFDAEVFIGFYSSSKLIMIHTPEVKKMSGKVSETPLLDFYKERGD